MYQRGGEAGNKVFVGSIPGYFRKSDVVQVFSGWGVISKVKLDYKNDNPHLNKGFCVLTMQSTKDAQMILEQRLFHIGGGRYLVCKPFLQGHKLHEEILRHDRKRVILKQVPAELSEKSIADYFKEHVGPIEVMFIYQPDDQGGFNSFSRRWRSASITFQSQSDVDKLFSFDIMVQETKLLIHGFHVVAQRFKFHTGTEDDLTATVDLQLIHNLRQAPKQKKKNKQKKHPKSKTVGLLLKSFEDDADSNSNEQIKRELNHKLGNLRFNVLKPQGNRNISPMLSHLSQRCPSPQHSLRTKGTAIGSVSILKVTNPADNTK